MRCSICGGRVIWMGRLSNLTHTKCQSCGALNSQIEFVELPDEAEGRPLEDADDSHAD